MTQGEFLTGHWIFNWWLHNCHFLCFSWLYCTGTSWGRGNCTKYWYNMGRHIYNMCKLYIVLNSSFIPLATRRRRRRQKQATKVIKMGETVTVNTAALTVGMTEASEKLIATTTVHFGPLSSSESVLALQNLAILQTQVRTLFGLAMHELYGLSTCCNRVLTQKMLLVP